MLINTVQLRSAQVHILLRPSRRFDVVETSEDDDDDEISESREDEL